MKNPRIDYKTYKLNKKEMIFSTVEIIAITCVFDYLFFENIYFLVLIFPLGFLYFKWKINYYKEKRKEKLTLEFKEALTSINISVGAGASVENATINAITDMKRLFGSNSYIVKELIYIKNQLTIQIPIEKLFLDLGKRSNVEDIENFALIFITAKRIGGSIPKIISKVTEMLGDKIEVKKEIMATIATKKMEQLIMSLMPAGIILYLKISSPSFFNILYGNPVGIFIMSIVLIIYIFAFLLGKKIVNIEV